MALFSSNPVDEHIKQGMRLRDVKRREFNAAQSVEHFHEAIKLDPGNYRAHFELARTYMVLPEMAVLRGIKLAFVLTESTRLALAEFDETARLKPSWDPIYVNMAHCYMILGDKKRALEAFEKYLSTSRRKVEKADEQLQNLEFFLLKRKKKRPDPNPRESEEHLKKAVELLTMGGRERDVEKEFEKAREIAPDFRWFYERIYRYAHY